VNVLRLCEDVLPGDAGAVSLPALPRMIYVVHGSLSINGRELRDDEAWHGQGPATIAVGKGGAMLWRWELADESAPGARAAAPAVTREKLAARLETPPKGALLLRGDSVAFPPGGCAYLHRHQGPGIRCLLDGGIRIDTHGGSTCYGPGGAWYESGPEPVFAQAADRPTRFVRVMILPLALLGKSSIAYVNEEDKARPKSQQYKIYADMPIALAAGSPS